MRLAGCVLAVLTVAACAPATGDAVPQETTATRTGGDRATGSADSAATSVKCTSARKVSIVKKPGDGRYAFSPSTLTIQRGGFLAISNRSDEVHELVTEPDAGIVSSVLDLRERQVIQFPEEGTFTVRSAAAAHRAVLHLTVSGESGCRGVQPTLTVTAGYAFSPTHLSLAATQNFSVVNESDTAQSVICSPDPGGNSDHSRLEAGETQLLAIDKPGRYACTSVQHPSVRATVTVNGK